MRIENLANIINAKIQNEPAISEVCGFGKDAGEIKFGECYFANSFYEIQLAIQNKAYAVVYDFECEIIDQEVAFLKVDDVRSAIFRLIRFFGINKNLSFVFANKIKFEILKRLKMRPKVISKENLLRNIYQANSEEIIFLQENEFMDKISFSPVVLKSSLNAKFLNNSLFFCNIICANKGFDFAFPRVFGDEFCGVCEFLESKNIDFRLGDFANFPHFKAIFVNSFLKPVAFGSSQRAIICEQDENLFIKEAEFLLKFDPKTQIYLPKNSKINLQNSIYFDDIKQICAIGDFRYALVLCEYEELLFILENKKQEITLFD